MTENPEIKEIRVMVRESHGGHGVLAEKIKSRYKRCIKLLPELVGICDVMHIYDNSKDHFRIFKKRKTEYFYWENEFWDRTRIEEQTGIKL